MFVFLVGEAVTWSNVSRKETKKKGKKGEIDVTMATEHRRFDRRDAFMSSGMYRAGNAKQNIDTVRSRAARFHPDDCKYLF